MAKYSVESNFDEVDSTNPFSDDLLSNGAWEWLAKNLVGLLGSDFEPITLSIEAPWGSGKTHFLTRFSAYIQINKSTKLRPIVINAWENDYVSDPFEVLIYNFAKAFPIPSSGDDFKRTAGTVLKNLTFGAIDQFAEKYIGEKISTGDMLKEVDSKSHFEKKQSEFKEFEESKRKLCEIIQKQLEETDQIGVIIIDELDRCHPSYAIEFLERVKHFFAIPRLKFIFGVDHEQLAQLAKGAFGKDIDVVNYLGRFFNLRLQLPVKPVGAFPLIVKRFEDLLGDGKESVTLNGSVYSFCEFLDRLPLTPRQKQLMASKLALVFRYCNGINRPFWRVVALALLLEEKKHGILTRIFSERRSPQQIVYEIVETLLKETVADGSQAEYSMDRYCIPTFFAVLFGSDEMAKEIAIWLNHQLYPEFTKGIYGDRVKLWQQQLADTAMKWPPKDRSLLGQATSLASIFRL